VPGYRWTATPRTERTPVDACVAGTAIVPAKVGTLARSGRDDGSARVALPFPFEFFGDAHREIWVAVDGVAGFPRPGEIFNPGRGGNGALPATGAPALIAPWWDDLVLGPLRASELCHEVKGPPGARRFIVTWRDMQRFGRKPVALTFSLVLEEGGTLQLVYDRMDAGSGVGDQGSDEDRAYASGGRASVGLQSAGGVVSVVYAGGLTTAAVLRATPVP
jgi:hypothetical protein